MTWPEWILKDSQTANIQVLEYVRAGQGNPGERDWGSITMIPYSNSFLSLFLYSGKKNH